MFGPLIPLLFSFVLLPLLVVLLQVQAVSLAFANLGLTPTSVIVIFYLSLLGSFVNIPLSRRKVRVEGKPWLPLPFPIPLFYYPPRVQRASARRERGRRSDPHSALPLCLAECAAGQGAPGYRGSERRVFRARASEEGRGHHHSRVDPSRRRGAACLPAGVRSGRTHGGGICLRRHGHTHRRRSPQLCRASTGWARTSSALAGPGSLMVSSS